MVVDTSAIVAVLLGEPEAERFSDLSAEQTTSVMSGGSYVELTIVALGRGIAGRSELDAVLQEARISALPVTRKQIGLAATAFEKFGRGRHPASLNFGDCFAYALAKSRGSPLLCKGGDFPETDVQPAIPR